MYKQIEARGFVLLTLPVPSALDDPTIKKGSILNRSENKVYLRVKYKTNNFFLLNHYMLKINRLYGTLFIHLAIYSPVVL